MEGAHEEKFISRLKEIEKWAAHNKELVLGGLLAEQTTSSIGKLIESAKPEKQTDMIVHIFEVLASYLVDNKEILKNLAGIKLVDLPPNVIASVGKRPDGKLVLLVNNSISLTSKTRLLLATHEKEHIMQMIKGIKEKGPILRIPEPRTNKIKEFPMWSNLEVGAQRKAFKQLERVSEKIRNMILFNYFDSSVLPPIIEGGHLIPDARSREDFFKLLNENFERRKVSLELVKDLFSDAADFYNYHFGPLVHEKDDISREEHWEAYLDALRLLKRYASYRNFFHRIRRVAKESMKGVGNIYERVAEEAKNFFKKVSDDGLPILPILFTTHLYAVDGAIRALEKKKRRKRRNIDTYKLYWHIVTKALEVLEEKYKKEPRKEGP